MPRPLRFPELFQLRFRAGTLARIERDLEGDQTKIDWVRAAVSEKLNRIKTPTTKDSHETDNNRTGVALGRTGNG